MYSLLFQISRKSVKNWSRYNTLNLEMKWNWKCGMARSHANDNKRVSVDIMTTIQNCTITYNYDLDIKLSRIKINEQTYGCIGTLFAWDCKAYQRFCRGDIQSLIECQLVAQLCLPILGNILVPNANILSIYW